MRSNLEVILSTHGELLEVAMKREKDSHKKGSGKKNVFILRTRKTELNLKEIHFNKRP